MSMITFRIVLMMKAILALAGFSLRDAQSSRFLVSLLANVKTFHCLFTNNATFSISSPKVQYLGITDGNLTTEQLIFIDTPYIQDLILPRDNIETICRQLSKEKSIFVTLHHLLKLDLSRNKISTISEECVLENHLLTYLNLSHNAISYIHRNAFSLISN